MNRFVISLLLFGVLMVLCQCGGLRSLPETEPEKEENVLPDQDGTEGLEEMCLRGDTVNSVLIKKAETLFIMGEDRYEAQVSIYAIKDSLIYISAVNSGFEILRAAVDSDSIRVIDRINKVVYISPVKKKFGHQNPMNFGDIQHLVSRYYLCDIQNVAEELDFTLVGFNFSDPKIKKLILLDRQKLQMEKFEFMNTESGKYFMGERKEDELRIYSNFMFNNLEVVGRGGEVVYNQRIEVKMNVNRRKYAFMNF